MPSTPTSEQVRAFNRGIMDLAAAPAASSTVRAFQHLHDEAMKDGAATRKTKELVALGIAISKQCDGCISWHVSNAVSAGATSDEVLEVIGVAVMMGGGPATYYASKAHAALIDIAGA